MNILHHIRQSFATKITCWVVGISTTIFIVILLLLSSFSKADVSGASDMLLLTGIITAVVSVVIIWLVCRHIIARHLHPLSLLADSAQHIADGLLKSEIENLPQQSVPNSNQQDEIGQLQNSFAMMHRSLVSYMTELQQKRNMLSIQNEELEKAYKHAQESDSVKTNFINRMTVQMSETVEAIDMLTKQLCAHHSELSKTEMMNIQIQMLAYTDTVTHLLEQMLNETSHQEEPL